MVFGRTNAIADIMVFDYKGARLSILSVIDTLLVNGKTRKNSRGGGPFRTVRYGSSPIFKSFHTLSVTSLIIPHVEVEC